MKPGKISNQKQINEVSVALPKNFNIVWGQPFHLPHCFSNQPPFLCTLPVTTTSFPALVGTHLGSRSPLGFEVTCALSQATPSFRNPPLLDINRKILWTNTVPVTWAFPRSGHRNLYLPHTLLQTLKTLLPHPLLSNWMVSILLDFNWN